MTCCLKFKAQNLPSFDLGVHQMSCIWQNIIRSSLPSWRIWIEMGNRMIDRDFIFQTWHAGASIHTPNLNLAFIPYWNHHWNSNVYRIKSNRKKCKGKMFGWAKSISNFKRDMLYKVQGSKSSFFWLQGPPDALYLKE